MKKNADKARTAGHEELMFRVVRTPCDEVSSQSLGSCLKYKVCPATCLMCSRSNEWRWRRRGRTR